MSIHDGDRYFINIVEIRTEGFVMILKITVTVGGEVVDTELMDIYEDVRYGKASQN